MNKKQEQEIIAQVADLQAALTEVSGSLKKEQNANKILKEMCARHEAQLARAKMNDDDIERLFRRFRDRYFVEFHEIALSILSLEKLTPTPRNFFNSKLLERMILDFAPVVVFENNYKFADGEKVIVPLVLPITPAQGVLDVYGGAPIVRPYPPSGTKGGEFPELVPGVNCVVFTDFYEYSQTNANTSPTVRQVIDLTAEIVADIEVAKFVNRRQIQLPFIFNGAGMDDGGIKKMAAEISDFVAGVTRHKTAVLTPYADNIEVINTGVNYHGDDLEKAKRDAIDSLYRFLGIGTIKNENKARKITAEFEKTADEYNINITSRLQLRNKSLEEAKRIFPQWFPADCYYKVNLAGYNTADTTQDGYTIGEGQGNDE